MTRWKLDVTWRCHGSVFPAGGGGGGGGDDYDEQTNQPETNEKAGIPRGRIDWGRASFAPPPKSTRLREMPGSISCRLGFCHRFCHCREVEMMAETN